MTPKQFWTALAFGIIVTLGMNALDMLYHVATNTAVHLNYVAVKALVIFTTVFLIALVVGRGKIPGIVTSILGPVAFYIYYSFATPTLNRAVFTIDDAVGYIFVHIVALGLVYWLTYYWIMKKDEHLPFAITVALASLPLYWGWLMMLVKLAGGLDEHTTTVLGLGSALIALGILLVLSYLATMLKSWWPGIIAGVVFGVIGYFATMNVVDSVARVFILAVPYLVGYTLRGEK